MVLKLTFESLNFTKNLLAFALPNACVIRTTICNTYYNLFNRQIAFQKQIFISHQLGQGLFNSLPCSTVSKGLLKLT